MSKSNTTVFLPNPVPEVTLPQHLAAPLKMLIAARAEGVTTLLLQKAGCLHPAHAVSKLRKRGAVIETQRCQAADSQGAVHKGVARYVYKGWVDAAEFVEVAFNQKEVNQ